MCKKYNEIKDDINTILSLIHYFAFIDKYKSIIDKEENVKFSIHNRGI